MAMVLDRPGDTAMADYLRFHAPRFRYVIRLLERFHRPGGTVLDIGWSRLTGMIRERFGGRVDALGFDDDGPIPTGQYYHFDLNACQQPKQCRADVPGYDTIVFAEVLEHLHTAPSLVLRWLAGRLRPGGVMIVQTPNGVALPRRVKMLLGRNPFELIREDASNPGHFREYTAAELIAYLGDVGLQIEHVAGRSDFDFRFAHHGRVTTWQRWCGAVKNIAYPLLPGSLRPGLTVVARRPR